MDFLFPVTKRKKHKEWFSTSIGENHSIRLVMRILHFLISGPWIKTIHIFIFNSDFFSCKLPHFIIFPQKFRLFQYEFEAQLFFEINWPGETIQFQANSRKLHTKQTRNFVLTPMSIIIKNIAILISICSQQKVKRYP